MPGPMPMRRQQGSLLAPRAAKGEDSSCIHEETRILTDQLKQGIDSVAIWQVLARIAASLYLGGIDDVPPPVKAGGGRASFASFNADAGRASLEKDAIGLAAELSEDTR